jgi:leucyl-tRNA synthetase
MELVNELYAFSEEHTATGTPVRRGVETPVAAAELVETIAVMREAVESLILMLAPFAPHVAEEMWEATGHERSLASAAWPAFDAAVARAETIVVPVQVNGKLRARLTVPADASEDDLRARALADPGVQAHTAGRAVRNVVVARGRLVNIVAK